MSNPYFIEIKTAKNQASKNVKEKYDFTIDKTDYVNNTAYPKLTDHITDNIDKNIIVVSCDTNIPQITSNIYKNLVTLYVSNNPIILKKTETIYLGIDKDIMSDDDVYNLSNSTSIFFNIQKIQKNLIEMCNNIMNLSDGMFHIIYDLQIIDKSITPSVRRNVDQNNFLIYDQLVQIINIFKKKTKHLDIIGFDDALDDQVHKYTKLTGEICKIIIKNSFDIIEKSINIFTEDSRFLIFRCLDQNDPKDVGWNICKLMTLKERDQFIKILIDKIEVVTINDENDNEIEYYVTTTSIDEQNKKSYFCSNNIYDCCLLPHEKTSMMFELINA